MDKQQVKFKSQPRAGAGHVDEANGREEQAASEQSYKRGK
jgi:hypothetical protein